MREGAEETKAKAPISTAVAKQFRDVFEDVKLTHVKEGEVELGKPDTVVYATCFHIKKKNERRAHKQ